MNIWELKDSANLEPELTPDQSKEIGRLVYQGYETDKRSRREWDVRMENAIKLAIQMREPKSWPWPGASNVKFPLVTIAALQFSARAYPALVKAPTLVKYRVNGKDSDGSKAARASRISRHMSYQLLEEDEYWEEDFDKALIALPILGTIFKKSFFDSVKGHNVSKLTLPQNLYVNYYARSIEDCERKTEEFELSEREIKERQLRGVYSDKELGRPQLELAELKDERQGVTPPPDERNRARRLLEQHRYLDLDEDGYEEPYVVTVDKSSKEVLRIVSRFADVETEQSIQIDILTDQVKALEIEFQAISASIPPPQEGMAPEEVEQLIRAAEEAERRLLAIRQQQNELHGQIQALEADNQKNPKILRVVAEEHYTKYGFIPSPDGGFYELGLGALLGPLNDSVNTLINQLIDSGTMNVGSHGFIGRGARIPGGRLTWDHPFEWKQVRVSGQRLRDNLVHIPTNPPSMELFNLLSLLISYSERVASVNEAMSGQNPGQNTPAYNYHAMLEQGMQVFNGIFKRVYRSMRKEFRKLYVLNQQYLNPIEYFETLDGRFDVLQSDYQGDDKDVIPAADPNAFSNMEGLMKATAVLERATAAPGYNVPLAERWYLEMLDVPNVQELYPLDEQGNPVIQPPPNPEIELEAADLQSKVLERKSRQETNAALAESQIDLNDSQIVMNIAKSGQISEGTAVEKAKVLMDKMKARDERIKAIIEASQEDRRLDIESRKAAKANGGATT